VAETNASTYVSVGAAGTPLSLDNQTGSIWQKNHDGNWVCVGYGK
jgi:hypothetical protein